jgi:PAS domain S-box-containing protein
MGEQRKTILLVEDEFLLAMNEKTQLEKCGYAVLIANSGEKAVEFTNEKSSIDLILMDINLGNGIDGTQAAEAILKAHDIPIVFLSSHIEKDVVEKTEKISSYGYVVKNSSITVIDASIKMAFKLYESKKTLLTSNSRYEKAQQISHIGSWEYNPSDNTFWGDDAGKVMYGFDLEKDVFSSDEVMNCVMDKEYVNGAMIDLLTENKPYNIKFAILTKDTKGMKIIHSIAQIGKDGKVTGVLRNITSEYTLENELARNSSILNAVLDNAPTGISITDKTQSPIKHNKRLCEILQLTEEEYIDKKYLQRRYIRKDGTPISVNEFPSKRALDEKKAVGPMEIGIIKEDGGTIWVNASAAPLGNDNAIVMINDITEIMEGIDIKEYKNPLSSLLSSAVLDAIVMLDENFLVSYWNISAEKMFGYSQEDVMGKDLHEMMVPEIFAERYRNAHEHYRRTGEGNAINQTIDAEVIHKDGHIVLVEMSLSAHRKNNAWHSLAIMRDISKRKAIEYQLNDALAEKELILKEVHHRIKNNMGIVASLLALQAAKASDPSAITILQDAGNRIQNMSILYDKLYRSASFTELSIKDYLSGLVDEIMGNFPNSHMVKVLKHIQDFKLDSKRLQTIGIVINELITNIMKYAFVGKSAGMIIISATNLSGRVSISVQDDGSGMPESVSFEDSTGFGLQLIDGLSRQLHGAIGIERVNGTKIILEFQE